ncbi:MAG TPA: T9SS type A sorting domain-containing protein [Candidatus Krumholzibacteria bacterium]|nr:T9SS type A sorting domain-containing protein [Candidatus Krumholzibacteria bacterium]
MRHVLPMLLAGLLAPSLLCAATITSTSAGGSWSAPGTWVGGVVPSASDDVILAGPVTLADVRACAALAVDAAGSLLGTVAPSVRLEVAGDVTVDGAVLGTPPGLTVRWGGHLTNAGTWSGAVAEFAGAADATIAHDPGHPIEGGLRRLAGATGRLTAVTPLTVSGDVAMGDAPLVLGAGNALTMAQGALSGAVEAAGNEIRIQSWSYLQYCVIDDAVLVGEVEAAFLVRFTTRVVIKDVLQNATHTGGGSVVIQGDLINQGVVRNNTSYSMQVQVSGNVHAEGNIDCSQLILTGAGVTHELSMGPAAVIGANVFLPEFQPAVLRAVTPVRFGNGVGVGLDGRLELAPGAHASFGGFGGMGQGTLAADGNDVSVVDSAALSNLRLEGARLTGPVPLHGTVTAVDGLEVAGSVTSWTWAAASLDVSGPLRVTGSIADGAYPVQITARGDVENLGALTCASLTLAGTEDQRLAVGTGVSASVTFTSGLGGTGHTWFRDGVPLPGETTPSLVFASGMNVADAGVYRCEAGGEISRSFIVLESLDTTDVPGAGVALLANHPNPFNPATEIVFSLERSGPVRLTVHDLAGRRVATLVDGEREAGRHAVDWRPRELASGTYLYRLQTADGVRTGRAALVR